MMNEKPIERLKYYNGQRLEADDLKLEQEYHIRVRRWLNKSLYSAGIAHGLEVRPEKDNPHQVVVSPGMALDIEGREIILLEEKHLDVIGKPSKDGRVEGNYLTIQYREETREEQSYSCVPRSKNRNKSGDRLAWGGPSRLRATPILGWSDLFPHESSGKIVLAQVELDNQCKLQQVHAYPRRYIGQAYAAAVRQYALEGERHIDKDNPGRIYFHIRGVQPKAVTLYLRAEKFSTLYYSELGQHNHMPTSGGTTGNASPALDWNHFHDLKDTKTKNDNLDGVHENHGFFTRWEGTKPMPFALAVAGAGARGDILRATDSTDPNHLCISTITGGSHYHGFAEDAITGYPGRTDPIAKKIIAISTSYDHKHTLNADGTIGNAGVSDKQARSEPDPTKPQPKALTYVDNLQIYIGRVDQTGVVQSPAKYTDEILTQLKNLQPAVWDNAMAKDVLGDGKDQHPLAKNGTGVIRLDLLSPKLSFPEGQYYIDLQVTTGGGRILYNLYVE